MDTNTANQLHKKNVINSFRKYLEQAFRAKAKERSKVVAVWDLDDARPDLHSYISRIRMADAEATTALLTGRCEVNVHSPENFRKHLEHYGHHVLFSGWLLKASSDECDSAMLAVIEFGEPRRYTSPPNDFRVIAFVPAYNEDDIINQTIEYLVAQGIEVYLLDNWSTDSTFAKAREWLGRGLIGLERFPTDGPTPHYEWRQILGRIEELSRSLSADWFVLHDCDERRESPWPQISYRCGIYYADRCGFNCVDHVVLNFWPTNEEFDPKYNLQEQLKSCSFSDHAGHFHQRKAWKNNGKPILLSASAGHDVKFEERRVYPYKFLIKHYPLRSQSHAKRKIFHDRMPRWSAEERRLGWHAQYDDFDRDRTFVWDPETFINSGDPAFYEDYLLKRISGIGIFSEVPAWATEPIAPSILIVGSPKK